MGEKGFLNLEQGQIYDSFSALVVKDSSKMIAKNIQTDGVKNCYFVYRKKQEFVGGYLKVEKTNCNQDSYLEQIGSKIYFN